MKTSIFILLTVLLFAACGNGKKVQDNSVWLSIDPIQCLENPWEKAWVDANSYEEYPVGHPRKFEIPEQMILREFFLEQDVSILEVKYKSYPEDAMVCEACTCPAGYSLFVSVPPTSKELLMEKFTFTSVKSLPDDLEQ